MTYNGPGIVANGGEAVGLLAQNVAANGNSIIDASGNISGVVPGPALPAGQERFTGTLTET